MKLDGDGRTTPFGGAAPPLRGGGGGGGGGGAGSWRSPGQGRSSSHIGDLRLLASGCGHPVAVTRGCLVVSEG
jgi:hypothetical protein